MFDKFVIFFIAVVFILTFSIIGVQIFAVTYGVTHAGELTMDAAHQACKMRAVAMGDKEALKTCEEMEKTK